MSISTADIGPWSWAEFLWARGNLQNRRIAVNFVLLSRRDWQHAVIKNGKRHPDEGGRPSTDTKTKRQATGAV
jgi:hypothetical protein